MVKYYSQTPKHMSDDDQAHYRYLRAMENIEMHEAKRLEAIGVCCTL